MRVKQGMEAAYADWKAKNGDGYGSGIFRFAERWADLMEARVADGAAVGEIANETSREADSEGITGYMYGAAVAVLAKCWENGEALRCWHNIDCHPKQGAEANKKPGVVLNPAVLVIGGES